MAAADLIVPIVHLNGTAKKDLIDQLADAADAVRAAGAALAKAAPNGRDYYPQPGLMSKAVAQHDRRMAALKALADELEESMWQVSQSGVSICSL